MQIADNKEKNIVHVRFDYQTNTPTDYEKKYLAHIGEWAPCLREFPITRPERLTLLESYHEYAKARASWGAINKQEILSHCLFLILKTKSEIRDSEAARMKKMNQ